MTFEGVHSSTPNRCIWCEPVCVCVCMCVCVCVCVYHYWVGILSHYSLVLPQ